jgi:hypothetical protein
MLQVEKIQEAINSLPPEQFARLHKWFTEKDWELWDKQIEEDSASGKLDFLVKEANESYNKGNLKEL